MREANVNPQILYTSARLREQPGARSNLPSAQVYGTTGDLSAEVSHCAATSPQNEHEHEHEQDRWTDAVFTSVRVLSQQTNRDASLTV